jgi:AraC-like DNA-binding protein
MSVRVIDFVTRAMIDVGIPVEPLHQLLDAHCVDRRQLEGRVAWRTYHELWQVAEAHSDDELLGLRVAAAVPFGVRDAIDYLMRSAATLEAMVPLVLEIARSNNSALAFAIDRHPEGTLLKGALAPGATMRPTMSDYGMARWLGGLRDFASPELAPARAYMTRPRPSSADAHDAYFRCPIHYGHPFNGLVVSDEWMRRPLPGADDGLHRVLLPIVRAALGRVPAPTRAAATSVAQALTELLEAGDKPLQQVVARRLGHSTRSLRRLLEQEHTTFGAILDETRRNLAQAQLLDGQRIDTVALELGFESTPAFVRAFRRWVGMPPAAWVRQHEA